jgi:2-keto-4-pentenoate hydratase
MVAGTVVTTGTWVGILTAGEGDLVSVEFPGIGRASVQL